MGYLSYILVAVAVWAAVYLLYLGLSKGLSASARHQQASRFAIASVLAVAPFAVAGVERSDIPLGAIVGLSALWCLTYPVIDLFSRRAHATEIDNKMDFAFGLYLCSLLSALWLALQALWPGNAVLVRLWRPWRFRWHGFRLGRLCMRPYMAAVLTTTASGW